MEVRSRRTDCEVAGHNQSSGITGAPESAVPTRVRLSSRLCENIETNRPWRPPAEAEPPQSGKPLSGGSSFFGPGPPRVRRCRAYPRRKNPYRELSDHMNGMRGKAAVITGAALGIGRACALRLADEGAAVALTEVKFVTGTELVIDGGYTAQ